MYEPAACPWCGDTQPVARYPDLHVVDCPHCGLRYASPQLTVEGRHALYAQSYFESADSSALGYEDYDADRPQLLTTFRERIQALTHDIGMPGRLLDVGCATGICVEAAHSVGWDAEGIDVSEFVVRRGRDEHGLPLHQAEVDTWHSPLAPYDAITMWDYIEHVPDPLATLRAAYALLRPGGRLVLSTPDAGSIPARWYGETWMGYKRDEHLVYFTRPHMRAFLRTAGFEPLFDHYVGKHIQVDFFCVRLQDYAPTLAGLLRGVIEPLRLGDAVIYINPLDIMCVTAERPAGDAA